MEINLIGKNALVGGSTSGIGKAIAQQLALSGANVTLVARNEEKLKSTIASLDSSKNQIHNYIVTDYADFESYKKTISAYFLINSVDILVNNTQGPSAGTVVQKSEQDYLQAFNLLFQTAVFTTNLALSNMKEKGFGRIINVSSLKIGRAHV